MNVLMIAHYTIFPWENGNGRFDYLANVLYENGHSVELVTSSFEHTEKKQRVCYKDKIKSLKYSVTMLHEPDYRKNVSIKRLRCHSVFAKNLKKYLDKIGKPDVVYCAVPSLDASYVAAEYCEKNDIAFLIDIQDLWPEAFRMVFNVPLISDLLFLPMKRKANKIYANADAVVAVSETYAARALEVNKNCQGACIAYLGTDKEKFDEYLNLKLSQTENQVVQQLSQSLSEEPWVNKIRLAYVGTLGSSYDLTVVFDAMRKLNFEELNSIEFVIMGDGPIRDSFEASAKNFQVIFTWALAYSDMVLLLTKCDIAVNPIVHGSAGSIINKHMDYAMAGLPIINTQECEEYRRLIDDYECGINCKCENSDDVVTAIRRLISDKDLRKKMGEQSRKMGEELFDRNKSYRKIVKIVEKLYEEQSNG